MIDEMNGGNDGHMNLVLQTLRKKKLSQILSNQAKDYEK